MPTIGLSQPAPVVATMLKRFEQCHMVVTIFLKTRGASAPSARKQNPPTSMARGRGRTAASSFHVECCVTPSQPEYLAWALLGKQVAPTKCEFRADLAALPHTPRDNPSLPAIAGRARIDEPDIA